MILIQEALLSSFAVDEIVTIEHIHTGPLAQIWRATVSQDGCIGRWCIKKHNGRNGGRLRFEAQLAEQLRKNGYSLIPRMIPTREGSFCFCWRDEFYSASQWIDADPADDWLGFAACDRAKSEIGGRTLAGFHAACRDLDRTFQTGSRAAPMVAPIFTQLASTGHQSLAAARTHLDVGDAAVRLISEHEQALLLKLEELDVYRARVGRCDRLIHGDFHAGNLLCKGGEVVAVLDLEFAHCDALIVDVAYGAYMFAAGSAEAPGDDLRQDCLEGFIAAYNEQARKLCLTDVAAVADSCIAACIQAAACLVGFWLLDQYVAHAHLRGRILPRLTNVIRHATKTAKPIEAESGKLYS